MGYLLQQGCCGVGEKEQVRVVVLAPEFTCMLKGVTDTDGDTC